MTKRPVLSPRTQDYLMALAGDLWEVFDKEFGALITQGNRDELLPLWRRGSAVFGSDWVEETHD